MLDIAHCSCSGVQGRWQMVHGDVDAMLCRGCDVSCDRCDVDVLQGAVGTQPHRWWRTLMRVVRICWVLEAFDSCSKELEDAEMESRQRRAKARQVAGDAAGDAAGDGCFRWK
eukprot:scaffold285121_cov15-Tisochrysis_lutea.AAC.1